MFSHFQWVAIFARFDWLPQLGTFLSYAPAVLGRASKWRVLSRQPTDTKKETKVVCFLSW